MLFGKNDNSLQGTRKQLRGTRTVITAGFTSIFVLLGLVLWLALASMESANKSIATLVQDTEKKTTSAYEMRDLIRLRSNQAGMLGQINDPQTREDIIGKIADLTARYNQAHLELESGPQNQREQEASAQIHSANERVNLAYLKTGNDVFSIEDNRTRLQSTISLLQVSELVLLKQLNDLVLLEKTLAKESMEANQKRYQQTQTLISALALIAIALGVAIAVTVVLRVARANRRISHLANHDDLTGLRNRRSFEIDLQSTLNKAGKKKISYGLLFLDLDRFKIINDSCGHHAGDQLLIDLTKRTLDQLGPNDMLYRLGGDEFAIIAQADSFDQVIEKSQSIRESVDAFVFTYEKREFSISMSIGVVALTGEITDMESILTEVDSACYVAKESGRNRVHVARKDDAEVLAYRKDLASIERIRHALNNEQFELFYQPVFNIKGKAPVIEHCEILLRIKHEDGELHSPEDFIPLAEKYNLMSGIDRWVVSHVIDWIEEHQQTTDLPRLLINLSALSYTDETFLAFLTKKLKATTIDQSRLAFEITETAAVDNMSQAASFFKRIGEFGCKFALDDFGTGFSTFAYLKQLPIDYLKIDGSLVQNICDDPIDKEMVRVINQVGHIVGAQTIAEYVENDDIVRSLQEIGVDYGQGFGLQRPAQLKGLLKLGYSSVDSETDRPDEHRYVSGDDDDSRNDGSHKAA